MNINTLDIQEILSKVPEQPVSRFAPTPSGYLHLGNILNFLLTWVLVRKKGGVLHLRIDDLDRERTRPEYVEDIFRTIDWLGLDYDKGPTGPDDFFRHYSQPDKMELYKSVLKQAKAGDYLFACECSRRELAGYDIYPGVCRNKDLKLLPDKTSLKIHVPAETEILAGKSRVALGRVMGDFVVWRRDGLAAYQLVSLVEDRGAGVNLIVRGEDLLPSTAAQIWLEEVLYSSQGEAVFGKTLFYHHPLLPDENGGKLSKSLNAMSVKALRELGKKPKDIHTYISTVMGVESVEKISDFVEFV